MKLLIGLLAVVGGAAWLLRREPTAFTGNRPAPAVPRRSASSSRQSPVKSAPGLTSRQASLAATSSASRGETPTGTSLPKFSDTNVAIHTPTAGYLDQILGELDNKMHRLERHDYLCKVVEDAYKERTKKSTAKILEYMAELHIKEFSKIRPVLKKAANGTLPRVPTFQKYAIFLTERGDYQRAIDVCQTAIGFGLSDGTKGGFPERIKRIRKKQAES